MISKKWYVACGVMGLFTACTQDVETPATGVSNEKIELNAGINTVLSRSAGPVVPGQAVTDVAFVRYDGETADWTNSSSTISAQISSSNGKVLFNESQFYPEGNNKVHFIAYHPATGATLTNGVVTYSGESMTGHQDIMYAPAISGSKDAKITTPTSLSHQLAQLGFKLVKGTGFPDNLSVTSISVEGTAKPEKLHITDGTLDFAAATSSLNVCTNATYQPTTEGTAVTEPVLVQPGATFTLTVSLSDGTTLSNIPVSAFTTLASHSHLVTLTFIQGAIAANAVITDWEEGDPTDGKVQ